MRELSPNFKHESIWQSHCATCIANSIDSLAGLTAALKLYDLELFFEDALAREQPRCDAREHESVLVSLIRTIGTREDPNIQAKLLLIDPGLTKPIGRYKQQRREPHKEITEHIIQRLGSEVLTTTLGGTSADQWRLGSRHQERSLEPVGETLSRIARESWTYVKGKKQYQVKIESGLNLLAIRFLKLGEELLFRLEFESQEQPQLHRRDWLRESMGLEFLGWYLELFGHVPEVNSLRAWARDRSEFPALVQVLRSVPMTVDSHLRLSGDLAVLQFLVHRTSALFPEARRPEELVFQLRSLGYRRLPPGGRRGADKREDAREALESAFRNIASDLERVVVVEVDWTPLRSKLKFKRARKNLT